MGRRWDAETRMRLGGSEGRRPGTPRSADRPRLPASPAVSRTRDTCREETEGGASPTLRARGTPAPTTRTGGAGQRVAPLLPGRRWEGSQARNFVRGEQSWSQAPGPRDLYVLPTGGVVPTPPAYEQPPRDTSACTCGCQLPRSPAVWTTDTIPGRIPSSPAAAHISSSTVSQAARANPPSSSRWCRKYGRSIFGMTKTHCACPTSSSTSPASSAAVAADRFAAHDGHS